MLRSLFKKLPHIYYLAGLLILSGLYFVASRLIVNPTVVHLTLDDVIPFVPAFIIPYILWYLYIPLLFILTCLKSTRAFDQMCVSVYSGMLFCIIIFFVFPTAIDFRPEVSGNSVLLRLCGIIFAIDQPFNVFPSLHCFESVCVHLVAFRQTSLSKRTGWRIASAIFASLICASTVFVKQHSVVDVVGGVLLAFVAYFMVCKVFMKDQKAKAKVRAQKDVLHGETDL